MKPGYKHLTISKMSKSHKSEKSPKCHQSERSDKPWDTIHIGLVNRFLTVTYIYSLMNLWWTKVPCIRIPKVHSELKTNCVKYFPFIAFCSEHPAVNPKLMKQKHLLQRGRNSAVWCITLLPPLRRRNAFLLDKIEKKNTEIYHITGRHWQQILFDHSHKKRKDSLETRAVFSWILILTWNFGGGRSNSASTFFTFQIASASCFWCY